MDFCDYITSIWKDDLLKRPPVGRQPPWGWIAWRVCELLARYPTGLTDAVIRQEVQQQWEETRGEIRRSAAKRHESLESVLATSTIAHNTYLELKVDRVTTLPGTQTVILSLVEDGVQYPIEMYLHKKYYRLLDENIIRSGATLRMAGCRLAESTAKAKRLLPTEFMAVAITTGTEAEAASFKERARAATVALEHPEWTAALKCQIQTVGQVVPARPPRHRMVVVTMLDCLGGAEVGQLAVVSRGFDLTLLVAGEGCLMVKSQAEVHLVLFDDETCMASLLTEGDVIVLDSPRLRYTPGIGIEAFLNPESIVFRNPGGSKEERFVGTQDPASQALVRRDALGHLDLSTYPGRLFISDIYKPAAVNITLIGWVVAVSDNARTVSQASSGDRAWLQITDGIGTCEITLWGEVATRAFILLPGQAVALRGIESTAKDPETGTVCDGAIRQNRFYLNCSSWRNGEIMLVNGVGLLNTPPLGGRVRYCADIGRADMEDCGTFVAHGCISKCSVAHGDNKYCGRPCCPSDLDLDEETPLSARSVKEGPFGTCRHCGITAPLSYAYALELAIDDGTGALSAEVLDRAMADLLQIEASQFMKLSDGTKDAMLKSVTGKHIAAVVTKVPRCAKFRIDALAPVHGTQTCDMLVGALRQP